jgi:endonuclease/exonuclease/phosphatase family metal-dependent hydrolase
MPAPSQEPPDGDPGQVRILHWNVHSWRDESGALNTSAVTKLISHTNPHVVSLVEVDETWSTPMTLRQVAASCGYTWVFCPSLEFGAGQSAGGFGNALLARIPVTAVQHWRLFTPARPYDQTEPTEPRSATVARLTFHGTPFWAGTTHLPRTNPGDRAAAATRLQQRTTQLDEPWFICGDFNAPPATLFADSQSIGISSPGQPTYPAGQPAESIDYCITAPGALAGTTVLHADGSDHLPLLVVTRLEHTQP